MSRSRQVELPIAGTGPGPVPLDPSVHACHAVGCTTPVPPERLMCPRHWRMVPRATQRAVWAAYRPGQCDDKRPSRAWHAAADAAIRFVREAEAKAAAVEAVSTAPPAQVIVCGGREFIAGPRDAATLASWLTRMVSAHGKVVVHHGDARGADRWAAAVASGIRGVLLIAYPARWGDDAAAGHERNRVMWDTACTRAGDPRLVTTVAYPGGSGTRHMVRTAAAGRTIFPGADARTWPPSVPVIGGVAFPFVPWVP